MSQKRVFVVAIMIWVTILTVWAVNKIADPLNNKELLVNGIPAQSMVQEYSTVQMDDNTVWIIDGGSHYIQVITRDENGFHLTNYEMTTENQ